MKFESCKDYFIHGKVIKLTGSGQERLRRFKITGTKMPLFFEGTKGLHEYQKNAYILGTRVFNFPEPKKRTSKSDKEKNHQFEHNIREYIKENIGVSFVGHPLNSKDIYPHHDIFGGVPDGEEFQGEKVVSVLEIKKRDISQNHEDFLPSYILQLSLYLGLRGICIGYICIFRGSSQQENKNPQNVVFINPLIKREIHRRQYSITLNSPHLQINDVEYPFEILEKGDNGGQIVLYKIKIDDSKCKEVTGRIKKWYEKYATTSPQFQTYPAFFANQRRLYGGIK